MCIRDRLKLESSDEELGTVEILFNEGLVEFKKDKFYNLHQIIYSDLCRMRYVYHKSATADSSRMFADDISQAAFYIDTD